MLKKTIIYLIKAYKWMISPLLPPSCRFHPTCSDYAMEAFSRHGAPAGAFLSVYRLLRCHPFNSGGYDPVPHCIAPLSPFKKSGKVN